MGSQERRTLPENATVSASTRRGNLGETQGQNSGGGYGEAAGLISETGVRQKAKACRKSGEIFSSSFLEIIGVDALEGDGAGGGDADVVLDHEVGEAGAVDEDEFLGDAFGVVEGVLDESAGGDEDAFVGLLAGEGSDEALDLAAADGALPALGLDVDDVEAEAVFVDDAVDAFVVGFFGDFGSFFAGAAVAHGEEEIDDELLEAEGVHAGHLVEELQGEGGVELGEGFLDAFVGGAALFLGRAGGRGSGGFALGRLPAHPLGVLRVGLEGLGVDVGRLCGEELAAEVSDFKHAAGRTIDEAGLHHVPASPAGAVDDEALAAAGEEGGFVFLGEAEFRGDELGAVGGFLPAMLGEDREDGEHEFLIGRDGHGGSFIKAEG